MHFTKIGTCTSCNMYFTKIGTCTSCNMYSVGYIYEINTIRGTIECYLICMRFGKKSESDREKWHIK